MTAKEELLDYILNLTDEQVDKIIRELPLVLSALEENSLLPKNA